MKQTSNYRFFNWAKNFNVTAANYYQPETEAEIVDIVKHSHKVRMVGAGHSWSAICFNNTALLNLDLYNKVLELDKGKRQVRVQAGIKLWQLNNYLDKHGFALLNLGSIDKQSVAGAINTATHGSGINYQILGSQIEEFKLVKADGELVVINCQRDKQLFEMALVGLGALGVVTEVVINIVPVFNLHDETYVTNFDEVINNLDEYVKGTDHFKLWWFPHIDEVVVYRYTRTNDKVNDSPLRQWLMDKVLSVIGYRLMLALGNVNRNWRIGINGFLVRKMISPLSRIEKSYKVFVVPEPPLHRETEWGFDLSIAKDLLREYKATINKSAHRINFLQEIRFTKADNFALSPCYGRNTMWLGAYNADNFGWNELLADFEMLAKKYNGRPHWGKEFNIDKAYIAALYPQYNSFCSLRNEMDPDGKFVNDYIARIFL